MEEPHNTRKRILVVDDEPAITEVCQRTLGDQGFEVDIAVNGGVAQDMVKQARYDLLIVDIRTPGMDGKSLYRWLDENDPQVASRVIFTTGDVGGGDTQSFLSQTGRLCLAKPFTPDELAAVVAEQFSVGEAPSMPVDGEQVLVVDDEESIRALIRQMLDTAGYEVATATNGQDALDKMAQSKPGMVLLDVKMPGMSGIEVLRRLAAEWPDISVIMVTVTDDTRTAVETMKLGAYDYINKPFDSDELVLSVGRALERRRLVLENRDYQFNLERKVSEQTQILEQRVRELTGLNNLFQRHLNEYFAAEESYRALATGIRHKIEGIEGLLEQSDKERPSGLTKTGSELGTSTDTP